MKKETTVVIIALVVLVVLGFYLGGWPLLNFNPKNPNSIQKNVLVDSMYSPKHGSYLTDSKGMTLYVYTLDERLKSKCDIMCQKTWRPFIYDGVNLDLYSDKLSQRLNVLKRDDGSSQYAYGIKPLYYYINDNKPGDINGLATGNRDWEVVTANK